MFGSIGMPELIIILVIALIIFGPRKLPELGKSLGRSLNEFKKASNDLQNTLEQEIKIEEQKETAAKAKAEEKTARSPRSTDHTTTTEQRRRRNGVAQLGTFAPYALYAPWLSFLSQARTVTTTSRTCPRSREGSRRLATTKSRPAKAG